MARRSSIGDPEALRSSLVELLTDFEGHLKHSDLREQVRELIPANHLLRDLGSSLLRDETAKAARERILRYLLKYVGVVIEGEELMVIGGISEYARRIRELRVEHGWKIITGYTVKDMKADDENGVAEELDPMKPDDYMLLTDKQDRDAAYRWNVAKTIRNEKELSVRDKILKYFRKNVGKEVSGEELRYVAKDKSEWARRTRELRTEYGWPIATQNTGRPDLPVSMYVLLEDRQAPEHDRVIKDAVRREVYMRDKHTCRDCGWNHGLWNPSDARHLEAHHVQHHADGGENTVENLVTLCNICHDVRHRKGENG
ncbi:HNH endonuclease [Paucidesulfovibrio gracilis DSM 16080]|uniref:HNH endonuclease n=1 Tax=Paucidesulfovibrio gracilis DSM 16080 TaxID=1121449 RepID=A0A1T4Y4H2_9BACT|nr:HNH endonuclease signature motif containing protein [Paucidesulfovibrio gracilis]SKA96724.1 HNH endonuclease [Paucidesulfovibrio gracilis DSM 16080]